MKKFIEPAAAPAAKKQKVKKEKPRPLYAVAISTDGKQVASAGTDGRVRVYNTLTGQLVRTMAGHVDAVYRLAFSAAGNRLLSCGHSGVLRVWNTADGKTLYQTTLPAVGYFAAYTPGGKQIVATCADSKTYLVPLPLAAR